MNSRKNTKKVDIIIVAVLILLIAGGILLSLLPKSEPDKNTVYSSDTDGDGEITYKDYIGKRIGIKTGSNFEKITFDYFPDSEYVYFDSSSDLAVALQKKKIDAFLDDEPVVRMIHTENSDLDYIKTPLMKDDYSFMFKKGSERSDVLLSQFNELLAGLKENGRLSEIEYEWFSNAEEADNFDRTPSSGKNGKITVAGLSDNYPFCYYLNNELTGFAIELITAFAQKYDYTVEYECPNVVALIAGISAGTYDIAIGSLSVTEERRENANFSDTVYKGGVMLMARASDLRQVKVTYKKYAGSRVGILTGSSFEAPTLEYLPYSKYYYFDTLSDLIMALKEGNIDCFIEDEPVLRMAHAEQPDIDYLKDNLREDAYSFCFRKTGEKSEKLRKQFNEMLAELTADGTLESIRNKWFESDPAGVETDRSGITGENGTLNVFVNPTNVPFCLIADGELKGYAVELMTIFCRRYGYNCEYHQTNIVSGLAGISSGIYDIGANSTTVTPERAESVSFSDPIYHGGITLAVRSKDIASPDSGESDDVRSRPFSYYAENKKIGAITGGLYEIMIRERYPEAEILQYNNQPDMAVALSAGVIDAFTCPESTAKDFIKADPSLTYLDEVFMKIPYGFAFEKSGDKEYLRDQMNEFLEKLHSDGTYDELIAKWFGDDESVKSVDMSGSTGENGTIRYITAPTMQPFSYIANGTNEGFEVDIVARFCKEYGYSLTIENAEFASLIPGITSGMYDIASGTIMITEERAESVNFSDVYYTANAVAVVKNEDTSAEAAPGFFESIALSFEKNFIREDRWQMILDGIGTTCLITVLSAIFGSILAFLVCMFRRTGSRLANMISDIYVKLLQGTPIVVLLMILYYVVLGKIFTSVWVAIIGFSLNFGAYASEIMRSGIESIDGGQREAALALGYNENQAFFRFIFPQAAVRFLPVYKQEIVSLLKSTSIVGYIAIQDLTKMSDIIRSRTYEAFFPLIATAIIYFILAWIISLLLKLVLNMFDKRHRKGGDAE